MIESFGYGFYGSQLNAPDCSELENFLDLRPLFMEGMEGYVAFP